MRPIFRDETHLVYALQQQQSGDFNIIYKAYAPALYGVLIGLIKDSIQAEDLLQETFIKIWASNRRYDPQQGRLFTWVMTIAYNVARDELRAKKTRLQVAPYTSNHFEVSINSAPFEGIINQSLLDLLSAKYRPVIDLVYYQGYTGSEVAKKLAMPLGTVKTYVRLGLQQLKTYLQVDILYYRGQ
jgi:RNA polymerase sigma-70 factor (ECF subfamily)